MPEAAVGFLCRSYTQPLVERCPDVDEVVVRSDDASLRADISTLSAGRWDVILFPNARPDLAIASYIAGIPKRIGTGYRWYSVLFNERIMDHRKTAEHNEATFNLRMLASMGLTVDPDLRPSIVLGFDEIARAEQWRTSTVPTPEAPYAVLHMGSGGSSHDWPLANWIELASSLADQFTIVFTGSEPELAAIQSAVNTLGSSGIRAHSFIGRPLPELAALLAAADLVVSGSTGPGHLAAALGAPTIGLFPLPLPLSKERWGFRGRNAVNLSPTPLASCPSCEDCTCMQRIAPHTVLRASAQLTSSV
jgi:heptosyltransferase-2